MERILLDHEVRDRRESGRSPPHETIRGSGPPPAHHVAAHVADGQKKKKEGLPQGSAPREAKARETSPKNLILARMTRVNRDTIPTHHPLADPTCRSPIQRLVKIRRKKNHPTKKR